MTVRQLIHIFVPGPVHNSRSLAELFTCLARCLYVSACERLCKSEDHPCSEAIRASNDLWASGTLGGGPPSQLGLWRGPVTAYIDLHELCRGP